MYNISVIEYINDICIKIIIMLQNYEDSRILGSLIIIENVNSKGHLYKCGGDDKVKRIHVYIYIYNKGLFADDNSGPRAIEII